MRINVLRSRRPVSVVVAVALAAALVMTTAITAFADIEGAPEGKGTYKYKGDTFMYKYTIGENTATIISVKTKDSKIYIPAKIGKKKVTYVILNGTQKTYFYITKDYESKTFKLYPLSNIKRIKTVNLTKAKYVENLQMTDFKSSYKLSKIAFSSKKADTKKLSTLWIPKGVKVTGLSKSKKSSILVTYDIAD
jgi:hypothetical protein